MTEPLLIAENLSCRYGVRTLFEKMSFSLAEGERLYISGANGAGKTSLLRILGDLAKPAEGLVRRRDSFHYVGHEHGFAPSLSVDEIFDFWKNLLGDGSAACLARAKEFAALEPFANLPASRLSAGQKRRLALSRIFLGARRIWLLDEAEQSLDEKSSARLEEALAAHCKKGGAVVMAGHHAEDARQKGARAVALG